MIDGAPGRRRYRGQSRYRPYPRVAIELPRRLAGTGGDFGSAIRYRQPVPWVSRADDGFCVEDGSGTDAEQDAAFEPDYPTESGGTGFGLATVDEVAEVRGREVAVCDGTDDDARCEFHGAEVRA